MLKIDAAEFVVLDVETTGLSVTDGDRIVEVAAMKLKNGNIIGTYHSLVNPKRLLSAEAMSINNITQEMVEKAPTADVVLAELLVFISGACVAGHNVRFDLNFICYELAMHGRKLPDATPVVDTLKMARDLLPYLSNHKLAYLARSLGVRVTTTHRALADVELTLQVLCRLITMAQEQQVDELSKFFTQFGIEKPSFRFNTLAQTSLF